MTESEFLFLRELAMKSDDAVVKVNVIRIICSIGCVLSSIKTLDMNPKIQVSIKFPSICMTCRRKSWYGDSIID